MSVHTRAIIEWSGTEGLLKEVFRADFDEYDNNILHIGHGFYEYYHPECDIFELKQHFTRLNNHKNCSQIYHRDDYIEDM